MNWKAEPQVVSYNQQHYTENLTLKGLFLHSTLTFHS